MQCGFCGTKVPNGYTVCSGCGAEYVKDRVLQKAAQVAGLFVWIIFLVIAISADSIGFMIFGTILLIAVTVASLFINPEMKWTRSSGGNKSQSYGVGFISQIGGDD